MSPQVRASSSSGVPSISLTIFPTPGGREKFHVWTRWREFALLKMIVIMLRSVSVQPLTTPLPGVSRARPRPSSPLDRGHRGLRPAHGLLLVGGNGGGRQRGQAHTCRAHVAAPLGSVPALRRRVQAVPL